MEIDSNMDVTKATIEKCDDGAYRLTMWYGDAEAARTYCDSFEDAAMMAITDYKWVLTQVAKN